MAVQQRFLSRLHDLLGWSDSSYFNVQSGWYSGSSEDFFTRLSEAAGMNMSALRFIPFTPSAPQGLLNLGSYIGFVADFQDQKAFIIRRDKKGRSCLTELQFNGREAEFIDDSQKLEETLKRAERLGGYYIIYPVESVGILNEETHNPQADPLRKLLSILRLDRRDIAKLYTYAIAGGLLSLALPLGIQSIINLVMGARISASLIFLLMVVLLTVLISGVLQVLQVQITESLKQKLFIRSAYDFARRTPAFSWNEIKNKYMPEHMNRFFDTLTIQKGIPKLLMEFTTAILQIVFGILLLSFYHPLFLFLSITLVAGLIFVYRITYKPGLKASLQTSNIKYMVAFWLEEVARAAAAFKLAGDTDMPLQKADFLLGRYLASRKKYFKVLLAQLWYFIGFKLLITGTLLIAGSLLVINQTINLGQFVASEIVIILIVNAVEKLIFTAETLFETATGTEKVFNVVEIPLERRSGLALSRELGSKEPIKISFQNVFYKEKKSQKIELLDASFEVARGEKVAILSDDERYGICVSELLSGLEEPDKGQIFLDDLPLRNISLKSLRRHVAGVFIYDSIIHGTVIENIHMGRKIVALEVVMDVVKKLKILRHTNLLPKELETDLLPQDRSVSQILLRKILLARALVEGAGIILIEQFDARDFGIDGTYISDLLVEDRNFTLMAGSHDAHFIRKCDKLLWIKNGKVCYYGSPAEAPNEPELKFILE